MTADRVSVHESGHAAALSMFKWPIVSVTVAGGRPHLKRGAFKASPLFAALALSTVCLAGSAAEELFFGSVDEADIVTDKAMARRYLTDAFGDSEIERHMTHARAAAADLVREWRPEIERVAVALFERETLTGHEIAELLVPLKPPEPPMTVEQLCKLANVPFEPYAEMSLHQARDAVARDRARQDEAMPVCSLRGMTAEQQ